jgi:hypothetical protein
VPKSNPKQRLFYLILLPFAFFWWKKIHSYFSSAFKSLNEFWAYFLFKKITAEIQGFR